MRGFQPGKAHPAAQACADGGVVQSIKGFLGFGKKKPEPLPADLNKMPPTGAGPAASQAEQKPQNAISQYSGMSALERRMKEAGAYANGGMVRGPGTSTSDDVKDTVPEGTYIMPADSVRSIGHQNLKGMGFKPKGVPVHLSNGEFKMSPEQVHAIGVQALDQMKGATHTPVAKGFAPREPGAYFVDGGPVYEEARRARMTPAERARIPGVGLGAGQQATTQASPPRPIQPSQPVQPQVQTSAYAPPAYSPGLGSGASTNRPSPAQAQPALTPPQTGGASGSWAPPLQSNSTPATTPLRNPPVAQQPGARFMPGTQDVWNESGKEIGALVDQGRYGAAVGETARATTAYVPAVLDDVIGGALRAVGPGIMDAGKQFLGIDRRSAEVRSPSAPATDAKVAPNPNAQDSKSPVAAAPKPEAPTPEAPKPDAQPKAQPSAAPGPFDGTGITKTVGADGRTSYSNVAGGGQASGGNPSRQNMDAADNLVARDRGFPPSGQSGPSDVMSIYARASEALKGVAGAQRALDGNQAAAGGGTYIKHSGNDWESEKNLRNLRTSASSITNKRGPRGAPSVEEMAYMKALDADMAARGGNNPFAIAGMREQGDTARAGMREQGEMQRTGMREQGDMARAGMANSIAQERLGLDRMDKYFQTRAMQRQEQLQAQYDAAKTPEDRAAIAKKVRDLAGKDDAADWKVQVTPQTKNPDGSTSDGSVIRYNSRTGDVQRVDGAAAGAAQPAPSDPKARKVGQVYVSPKGVNVRWTGEGWQVA